ncbi:hypothetical protein ACFS07_08255 [Undibacterium arcticum]
MNKAFAAILIIAAAMGIATVATAATAEDKLTYKAAQESAATEYKIAREKNAIPLPQMRRKYA